MKINDLRKAALTTLEVVEMIEVPHSDLLKKIRRAEKSKGLHPDIERRTNVRG